MNGQFESHRVEPTSGDAGSLVILLHGYGANGSDLVGLSEIWQPSMPDTLFVAPDAPQVCDHHAAGRQWFPIDAANTVGDMGTIHGLIKSFNELSDFIDLEIKASGVPDERTFLVGFSQGTMMALHVGPRRERSLAGIVGYSGRLLYPSLLKSEKRSNPPIILVHGEDDELLPSALSVEAAQVLKDDDFDLHLYTVPKLGHSIDMFGLGLALNFMNMHLGK